LIVRCPTREDADAVLELLEMIDVPPIQVKIDCLISEVYADLTLDWETTIEIQNLFGEGIRAGSAAQPFGTGITELVEGGEVLPAFPGASLRDLARTKMGLQIGYLSSSESFLAMVDLLESKGYLKILMHPTLEVVNGKTAKISSSQHVPLQVITKTIPGAAGLTTIVSTETEYIDVVDSLEITPHVFADGYIGLETSILLGSKLTPEGVKQLPIVTKKEIENKENRIRKGESLIIGGIRKTEKRDVARGVPFLKDIPILGLLFSGRDFEERVVETIFILTPTISTGGIPNKEMIEKVKRKHRTPTSESLDEIIADPFGIEAGEKARQLEAEEAERIRLDAEAEKARARYAVREAEEQAKRAEAELNRVKAEAEAKVKAAEEAVAKAKEEAERAKKEEEK
jgi:type II secretory pathway component GspD/PulD (secretin)